MSIAANAAASVVWLTAGGLILARDSTRVSTLEDLVGLTSDFLFVTSTFDGLAADFSTTLAAVLDTGLAAVAAFLVTLLAGVAAFVLVGAAVTLPAGLATTAFFSTGLLAFAALAVFADAGVVFAGFFIAFAIGSLPSG